jgi:hypothetical protein
MAADAAAVAEWEEVVGWAPRSASPGRAIAATNSSTVGLGYHQLFDGAVH